MQSEDLGKHRKKCHLLTTAGFLLLLWGWGQPSTEITPSQNHRVGRELQCVFHMGTEGSRQYSIRGKGLFPSCIKQLSLYITKKGTLVAIVSMSWAPLPNTLTPIPTTSDLCAYASWDWPGKCKGRVLQLLTHASVPPPPERSPAFFS